MEDHFDICFAFSAPKLCSVNSMYGKTVIKNKPIVYLKKEYKDLKTKIRQRFSHIYGEQIKKFLEYPGPIQIQLDTYFPDNRSRDDDNYLKFIRDCLQGFAYKDDKQIKRSTTEKHAANENFKFTGFLIQIRPYPMQSDSILGNLRPKVGRFQDFLKKLAKEKYKEDPEMLEDVISQIDLCMDENLSFLKEFCEKWRSDYNANRDKFLDENIIWWKFSPKDFDSSQRELMMRYMVCFFEMTEAMMKKEEPVQPPKKKRRKTDRGVNELEKNPIKS